MPSEIEKERKILSLIILYLFLNDFCVSIAFFSRRRRRRFFLFLSLFICQCFKIVGFCELICRNRLQIRQLLSSFYWRVSMHWNESSWDRPQVDCCCVFFVVFVLFYPLPQKVNEWEENRFSQIRAIQYVCCCCFLFGGSMSDLLCIILFCFLCCLFIVSSFAVAISSPNESII